MAELTPRTALDTAQREGLQVLLNALTTILAEPADGGEARVRTSAQEPRVIHDITPPNFQEPAVMTPSAFAPRVRTSTTVYRPPTPVQSYLFLADTGSSSLGSPQEDGPGARLYRGFERRWLDIETKFIDLEHAFRTVGSGGVATSSSRQVRLTLKTCNELYHNNLRKLYPKEGIKSRASEARRLRRVQDDDDDDDAQTGWDDTISDYIDCFRQLVHTCSNANHAYLSFISMYYSEPMTLLLENMCYRYESIYSRISKDEKYTDAQMTTAIRMEMHNSLSLLIEDMDTLSEQIARFIDVGIPMIRAAQASVTSRYLNMTTIAAFFSGVTATMIQFTFQSTSTRVEVAVNTSLMLSLAFSVGSAASSLLVMSWRQSCLRLPDYELPVITRGLLMKCPLVGLTLSGILFSLGLCLFVFSSNQGFVTRVTVPLCGGAYSFILLMLSARFVSEQWHFRKNEGVVGINLTKESAIIQTLITIEKFVYWCRNQVLGLRNNNDESKEGSTPAYLVKPTVDTEKNDPASSPTSLSSISKRPSTPISPTPTRAPFANAVLTAASSTIVETPSRPGDINHNTLLFVNHGPGLPTRSRQPSVDTVARIWSGTHSPSSEERTVRNQLTAIEAETKVERPTGLDARPGSDARTYGLSLPAIQTQASGDIIGSETNESEVKITVESPQERTAQCTGPSDPVSAHKTPESTAITGVGTTQATVTDSSLSAPNMVVHDNQLSTNPIAGSSNEPTTTNEAGNPTVEPTRNEQPIPRQKPQIALSSNNDKEMELYRQRMLMAHKLLESDRISSRTPSRSPTPIPPTVLEESRRRSVSRGGSVSRSAVVTPSQLEAASQTSGSPQPKTSTGLTSKLFKWNRDR